jgi:hypothetical protein
LIREIGEDGAQLTLITGPGRIFPFLRTHTILESLQPAMLRHPVVIFFPANTPKTQPEVPTCVFLVRFRALGSTTLTIGPPISITTAFDLHENPRAFSQTR